MAWYYNNVRLYVTNFESGEKYIIARLQPLGANTILQGFGTESPVIKLSAKVVGTANLAALIASKGSGPYTLSGVYYNNSDMHTSSINYTRDQFAYQTIDQAQDCEAPVYTVALEIYEDV